MYIGIYIGKEGKKVQNRVFPNSWDLMGLDNLIIT